MAETFLVTGQRQANELTAGGQIRPVMLVDFKTRDGATGTISVPVEDYSPEIVAAMLEQRAAAMDAISTL